MFESPLQRKTAHSQLGAVGNRTERGEGSELLKAMGAPVPPDWDLERCSLETTRKHLDSLESSDSPPASAGDTQNGVERNPVEEGDSYIAPTSKSPGLVAENRGTWVWVSPKSRRSQC